MISTTRDPGFIGGCWIHHKFQEQAEDLFACMAKSMAQSEMFF